jgi:hypothetical protein
MSFVDQNSCGSDLLIFIKWHVKMLKFSKKNYHLDAIDDFVFSDFSQASS